MKQKVSDLQIRAALESLSGRGSPVTWRALRTELLRTVGSAGRTDRLRAVCVTYRQVPGEGTSLEGQLRDAQQLLREAEQARDAALQRAERAEEREIRHQDRWAEEIHTLREAVSGLQQERARRHVLEAQVLRLQQELQSLYARLAVAEGG